MRRCHWISVVIVIVVCAVAPLYGQLQTLEQRKLLVEDYKSVPIVIEDVGQNAHWPDEGRSEDEDRTSTP